MSPLTRGGVRTWPGVDVLADDQWVEHDHDGGSLRLRASAASPEGEHRRLMVTLDPRGLSFGGFWVYTLIPEGERTRVRVLEDG